MIISSAHISQRCEQDFAGQGASLALPPRVLQKAVGLLGMFRALRADLCTFHIIVYIQDHYVMEDVAIFWVCKSIRPRPREAIQH